MSNEFTPERFAQLLLRHLPSGDDATALIHKEDVGPDWGPFGDYLNTLSGVTNAKSLECSIELDKNEARLQASLCHRESVWSITVRRSAPTKRDPASCGSWLESNHQNLRGYVPKSCHVYDNVDAVSIASYAEVGGAILRAFQPSAEGKLTGLLFITGGTNTGKSNVARGLIFDYLKMLPASTRNAHFLTYEDPIEEFLFKPELLRPESPFSPACRRVDYTPRQKGTDCKSLCECTAAALRQSPALLFCGEIRRQSDLAEAINFGGSGHLVVATGHAGSLIEATKKILDSVDAHTPGMRAVHIPKILGVVHLKQKHSLQFSVDKVILKTSAVVPAMYRRCPQGLQNFIAEGVGSLLPYCPAQGEERGSLGRQYMIKTMLKKGIQLDTKGKVDDDWKRRASETNSPQMLWQNRWADIRAFHRGEPRNEMQSDKPLWLSCAEDDIDA